MDVYIKIGSAITSTIPNIRIHISGSFIPAILEPAKISVTMPIDNKEIDHNIEIVFVVFIF